MNIKEITDVERKRKAADEYAAAMAKPLVTFEDDECCTKRLTKALRAQSFSSWDCPKCGTEWRLTNHHWAPEVVVEVFR